MDGGKLICLSANIDVSLFIDPTIDNIKKAIVLGANSIEIHTGNLSNKVKSKQKHNKELQRIKNSSKLANSLGIEVHAGHGLDYKTTKLLSKIKEIHEYNIGHFIIGESVFHGLSKVIKNFKKLLK